MGPVDAEWTHRSPRMGSQEANGAHLNGECRFSTTLADGQMVKGWGKKGWWMMDGGRGGWAVTGWSQEAACEAFLLKSSLPQLTPTTPKRGWTRVRHFKAVISGAKGEAKVTDQDKLTFR